MFLNAEQALALQQNPIFLANIYEMDGAPWNERLSYLDADLASKAMLEQKVVLLQACMSQAYRQMVHLMRVAPRAFAQGCIISASFDDEKTLGLHINRSHLDDKGHPVFSDEPQRAKPLSCNRNGRPYGLDDLIRMERLTLVPANAWRLSAEEAKCFKADVLTEVAILLEKELQLELARFLRFAAQQLPGALISSWVYFGKELDELGVHSLERRLALGLEMLQSDPDHAALAEMVRSGCEALHIHLEPEQQAEAVPV